MAAANFADRLLGAVETKRSHVVLGLDPDFELLPPILREKHEALSYDNETDMVVASFRDFLLPLLHALENEVVAVKVQIAYFEALGCAGYELYQNIVHLARELGYLVIADIKRGDIGSTAEAYARAHLDVVGADAVTVNPWFGTDGLEPFLRRARDDGKGVFVLVKTSNPSSREIQDLRLDSGETVYERVADMVGSWGAGTLGERGYRSVGAVIGGTHPQQAVELRRRMAGVPLLIPGYGAQGAQAADLVGVFDAKGTGAVVNSARAILYAYRKGEGSWVDAARAEAAAMRTALWEAAGRG